MASRAAKKKTLLLLMMMQDKELPVSYERRINYHSCTGDAPIFNINANSLFSSILFNHYSVQASPSSNTNVQNCGSLKC